MTPSGTDHHHAALLALGHKLALTYLRSSPDGTTRAFHTHAASSRGPLRIAAARVGSARLADLRGRLAELLLHAHREPFTGTTLVLIHGPRFGEQAWAQVRSFANDLGPAECGVALIDDDGGCRISIPPWGLHVDEPPRRVAGSTHRGRIFTDLNAWLLKVLILNRAPERHRLQTHGRVTTQAELARIAGVSTYTVNRLVQLLVERGHLANPRDLTVLSVERLLTDWIADAVGRIHDRRPARSIFGDGDSWEVLLRRQLPGRAALGGFHAATLLGVSIRSARATPEVHIDGDADTWLAALDLEPCAEAEAQLILTCTATPESVFRAAAPLHASPVPVVDLLQVALDVADRPARGTEQTEHVVQLVTAWWHP